MKNKNSIIKRLSAFYITYIIVVLLAVVGRLIPDAQIGYVGSEIIGSMIEPVDSSSSNVYLLHGVKLTPFGNKLQVPTTDSLVRVTAFNEQATYVIEEQNGVASAPFDVIGDSPVNYLVYLVIGAAFIYMLILIAKIILSLRHSLIEGKGVDKYNIRRIRIIGGILIVSELVSAFVTWRMQLQAAEVLQSSGLSVETAFSPDYWLIMLGVLVLFMGELFSLTHDLSEDQKLTI